MAVNLIFKNNIVADSRIVFGGIAPYPFRATKAEAALKGKGVKDTTAAVCRAATDGVQPMSNNGYKVDATRGILEEALSLLT